MHLAGVKDGISERFAPDQDRGRLIEVEHVSRYMWAAQAAKDRTVLDAGCGTAYGARLLAEGGAREVVGVDIAKSVLDAVAPAMPDTVRLEAGDLHKLAHPDDSFDLIVCFEVIEHFEDPLVVLDELTRVLAPEGLLLISSPNPGVYPEGNPHHFHEFLPEELEAELTTRLAHARLYRQSNYIVSAVLGDEAHAREGGAAVDGVALRKLIGGRPRDETYTVAMASNAVLPELPQTATMTGTLELREWLSVFQTQTDAIADKDNYIRDLEARVAERDRIAELLVDAEQRLAGVPELELRMADLEYQLAEERKLRDAARDEAQALDNRLMGLQQGQGDLMNSASWKLTKPLRAAKQRLRR
jgi:ubiquinone/menaquinone biosynthesis C-methylase UbiE